MTFNRIPFIPLLAVMIISGCGYSAARYRPIVDGATSKAYETDLQACQQLATQRSYLNDDVKTHALLGGAVGALLGGISEGVEGAIGGAALGGTLSGAGRAWETREERKHIVIECMRQRGHRVVG